MSELADNLRTLADHLNDWDYPITAKQDCLDAAEAIEARRHRRKPCLMLDDSRRSKVFLDLDGKLPHYQDTGDPFVPMVDEVWVWTGNHPIKPLSGQWKKSGEPGDMSWWMVYGPHAYDDFYSSKDACWEACGED